MRITPCLLNLVAQPVGKGATEDHRSVCKKRVHEVGMLRPIRLFAHGFALNPGRTWHPKKNEWVFHAVSVSFAVSCLFLLWVCLTYNNLALGWLFQKVHILQNYASHLKEESFLEGNSHT